ncbi:MAG TPA: Lrp/AsnC family transcriptional regulator [Methanosarcinaceae archaeon]|nr:Lrp/AsnC family transcriptional regulator [Methanosarcinaceae archaeon]HJH31376.1 Lrp/AsnC family transcriptional regulator [Methanosarcinaceae archaeon]
MELDELTLNTIRKHDDGVFQSILWKEMDIDSRKCSRIVTKLVKDGLVIREHAVSNGARTYLIRVAETVKPSFDQLLAGDIFSPCAGCRDACQPEFCGKLGEWILNLSDGDDQS